VNGGRIGKVVNEVLVNLGECPGRRRRQRRTRRKQTKRKKTRVRRY
jgi:hypothetical protein